MGGLQPEQSGTTTTTTTTAALWGGLPQLCGA